MKIVDIKPYIIMIPSVESSQCFLDLFITHQIGHVLSF